MTKIEFHVWVERIVGEEARPGAPCYAVCPVPSYICYADSKI